MVVMRFFLVYSGPLSGSGNKPKPDEVRTIRDQFHPQLKLLWETSSALRRLRRTAWVPRDPSQFMALVESPFGVEWDVDKYPRHKDHVDLCAPIAKDAKTYWPLVRKSLAELSFGHPVS
jgi:hypothetical protein